MGNIGMHANSLFREIKRRRVAKTSLFYVVLCWGALEVGDILIPTLDMEAELASQLFLYAAIAGFPVVLALAWFFQITPEGIVRTIPFVDRRVLNNISPINDRRHEGMTTYFRNEEDSLGDHWFITAESGVLTGLSYAVSQPLILGRIPDCEITIPGSRISRHHARLYLRDDLLMIEDLGSTNGTLVNGKLLEGKQTLRNGDELLFQNISFRVSENYAWGDGKASALSQTTFIKPIDDADSS
jgi:hypothetical protein